MTDRINNSAANIHASPTSLRKQLSSGLNKAKAKLGFGSTGRNVSTDDKKKPTHAKQKAEHKAMKQQTSLKGRSKRWIARHSTATKAIHTVSGAVTGGLGAGAAAGVAGGVIGAAAGGGIGAVAAVPAALVGGVVGAAAGAVAGFAAGRKATKDSLKLAQANIQNSRSATSNTDARRLLHQTNANNKAMTKQDRLQHQAIAQYGTHELLEKLSGPGSQGDKLINNTKDALGVSDISNAKAYRNAVLVANYLAIEDKNGREAYLGVLKQNLNAKTFEKISQHIHLTQLDLSRVTGSMSGKNQPPDGKDSVVFNTPEYTPNIQYNAPFTIEDKTVNKSSTPQVAQSELSPPSQSRKPSKLQQKITAQLQAIQASRQKPNQPGISLSAQATTEAIRAKQAQMPRKQQPANEPSAQPTATPTANSVDALKARLDAIKNQNNQDQNKA